jgi:hypothetical protein
VLSPMVRVLGLAPGLKRLGSSRRPFVLRRQKHHSALIVGRRLRLPAALVPNPTFLTPADTFDSVTPPVRSTNFWRSA